MAEDRMNFVPELRAKLKANLMKQGLSEHVVNAAFMQWDGGDQPSSPWVRACFQVFEKIQREVNAGKDMVNEG